MITEARLRGMHWEPEHKKKGSVRPWARSISPHHDKVHPAHGANFRQSGFLLRIRLSARNERLSIWPKHAMCEPLPTLAWP